MPEPAVSLSIYHCGYIITMQRLFFLTSSTRSDSTPFCERPTLDDAASTYASSTMHRLRSTPNRVRNHAHAYETTPNRVQSCEPWCRSFYMIPFVSSCPSSSIYVKVSELSASVELLSAAVCLANSAVTSSATLPLSIP